MASTDRDLRGKGLTEQDVIRQALEPKNLGPQAAPADVREWVEWKFPMVALPHENFDETVDRIRQEEIGRPSTEIEETGHGD